MTAFIKDNIPSQIDTLESLMAWCALALQTVNPGAALLETQVTSQDRCQVSHYNSFAKTRELSLRFSIPMDADYDFDRSKKIWMFAQEISTTALPVPFTVN